MIDEKALRERLYSLSDEKYREFNKGIVCTCKLPYIGVRTPELKRIAKELSPQYDELFDLPADSYEELLIKGLAVAMAKAPLIEKLPYIRRYAALIDNWAACDLFCSSLKVKKDERDMLSELIDGMIYSDKEYIARVGIVLFFSNFKGESDARRAFSAYERIQPGRYYVDMAIAWGISVYCVYFPALTAEYLESCTISTDIKKKAAQKIRDSRRVSEEVKRRVTKACERKS